MKVLLNATCFNLHKTTGIERFALRISQEISTIDPSISVVSSQPLPGISKVHIPSLLSFAQPLMRKYEYLLRALWDQTLFRLFIHKYKPDLVFFPIQDGMLFPPVKQIITVHDLHYLHFKDSVAECRQEINACRRFLFRLKMPHLLHKSEAIIAVSEATKRDIVETFGISPKKILVVYNGYDSGRFHISVDPTSVLNQLGIAAGTYFLCVGSVLRHKNLVRLVHAFAQQDTSMLLVIVGACKDPVYLQEVIDTSKKQAVADRVRYLEYVDDDDLPSLYRGATALVLPSLHEGFGVPIIEAMACGTPVITANCSAMPEVAGNAALLVDPYSVESIAAAMRDVLISFELVKTLRTVGLERVKAFKWSHSAQKLYDVFTMVCKS